MLERLTELIRGLETKGGYSRALQAARVRASYQRAYFAPALFSMIPVKTDLIASMAVDTRWRLYYNEAWINAHSVEENAAVLIHEVSHLLREHDARKHAAAVKDATLWNTATDCEINDDLIAEGLPLPDNPPVPERFGLQAGENAETYYHQLYKPPRDGESRESSAGIASECDCGSGAHGERRPWELTDDDGTPGGAPAVDPVKAQLVRREVAQRILDRSGEAGDAPLGWKRWANTVLTPQSGLHGDDSTCGSSSPSRQHARPVRSHLSAPASPAGVVRRFPDAVLPSATAAAGFPDRYFGFDAGHPTGPGRRGTCRIDAPTRLQQ